MIVIKIRPNSTNIYYSCCKNYVFMLIPTTMWPLSLKRKKKCQTILPNFMVLEI